jgi:hypothetical protein
MRVGNASATRSIGIGRMASAVTARAHAAAADLVGRASSARDCAGSVS